jgi:arylsulfatase A-like enzyme
VSISIPLLLLLSIIPTVAGAASGSSQIARTSRPNILFILPDQWRFDACGYAGNSDIKTPNLDRLGRESVSFVNAVSGLPVCCPMRASLLTGQRPLTHGVFLNDVPLNPHANTLAKVLAKAGYDTGYIGKWHLNGDGRSAFISRERRQGFDYWKALECTHDYNHSFYYGDTPEKREWEGYDVFAQTRDAQGYVRNRAKSPKPFFLMLAWGPPHDPYLTAPEKYRAMYDPQHLELRPNVPEKMAAQTRKQLAGYYSHCTALDDCIGELMKTLDESGLAENTLVVLTSDHGDMLGSQGLQKKQKPYDESIRVPLLFRWPGHLKPGQQLASPVNSEDLMPTILGLCGVRIPRSVEGLDFSGYMRDGKSPGDGAALLSCVSPFGEWDRAHGGKEYRGIRTARYTYVRDLNGPWLLFDNEADVFQTNNLVKSEGHKDEQKQLEKLLKKKLSGQKDGFFPGADYIKRWNYYVDVNGTVPYER